MNDNNEHPVWDVYNEYRTARLNVHYYGKQLKRARICNICLEYILLLTTSSGVIALWIWETNVGGYIWKSLIVLAALLAILKPLIKLSDKIQEKSELLTGWRTLDHELHKLTIKIRQYNKYDEKFRDEFLALLETKGAIVKSEPSESIEKKLSEKCYQQVNIELPKDSFYIPEDK